MSEKDTSIKRREFLKAGAATATIAGAAGVAGLAGSSCAGLFHDGSVGPPQPPLPDMNSYLERVDEGLAFISSESWSDGSPDGNRADPLDRNNGLGRKVLRSLYLAGMFGDLPDEGQAHPGMQERVARALPEMDEALDGTIDYLSSVSDDQVEQLQQFLREHDDPGMAIAEHLDRRTADTGVSTKRRLQTRAMITQVVARLKNQPPRQLFDEYIGKVNKQAALAGTVAESERYLTAQIGERAFWERQQRLALASARWQEEGTTAGGGATDALPADDLDQAVEDERERLLADINAAREGSYEPAYYSATARGERRIHVGGWVLGIGAVTTAVSLVFSCTSAWFVGAILGTAAAVLFIVALVLIIRGARNVRKGRESA
jgi:hypothetical protein